MTLKNILSKQRFAENLLRVSYGTLLFMLLSMITLFSLVYLGLSYISDMHSVTHLGDSLMQRLLNSLYFSVITTTTVGYGDMLPQGFSKLFAAIQSLMGFSVAAFFVTKLLSYRQELALNNINKLSFESTFHRIREELFIMRKDFDAMIEELRASATLSDQAWNNLAIACDEGQTILEEIPRFYDPIHHFYTIDEKREALLFEAVNRTLQRLHTLLDHMKKHNISIEDAASRNALSMFTTMLSPMCMTWQRMSSNKNEETFKRLEELTDSLQKAGSLSHA